MAPIGRAICGASWTRILPRMHADDADKCECRAHFSDPSHPRASAATSILLPTSPQKDSRRPWPLGAQLIIGRRFKELGPVTDSLLVDPKAPRRKVGISFSQPSQQFAFWNIRIMNHALGAQFSRMLAKCIALRPRPETEVQNHISAHLQDFRRDLAE